MTLLRLSEADLADVARSAVEAAVAAGADAASANAATGGGVRVTVRDGAVDAALRDTGQSLDVTVFRDGRRGSASTAVLDPDSIRRAVAEAATIAAAVQPDPDAGLTDPAWLAHDGPQPLLADPVDQPIDALIDRALAIGQAVADTSGGGGVRLDEAGIMVREGRSALATSAGFCRTMYQTQNALWAMVLAQDTGGGSVRDYAQSMDRRFDALDTPDTIAGQAVALVRQQVGGRSIPSRRGAVLFDARIASALVSDLVAALYGSAQYRRASVLLDSVGRTIAPAHVDLTEDPFEPYGLASGGYDGEGVAGSRRAVVEGGVVRGYFLGSVSARRLGLRSTGNAGGAWNLRFASREDGGDGAAMRRRLGTGLLVTRLVGGATDPVSGSWTRAVSGLWVEGGEVVHAVNDVTVAGNLVDMLGHIVAIGGDIFREGAIRTGSILIDDLQIGGTA